MGKAALLFIVGLLPVFGQATGQIPPAATATIAAAPTSATLPDHRIGPNDLIAIAVFNESELTRNIRVGSDGPRCASRKRYVGHHAPTSYCYH